MSQATPRFGMVQYAIIVLTVATAVIHFVLAFDWLFYANGLGYLGLLALLYLPIAALAPYRGMVRWVLIAYTAVTVAAWLFIGSGSPMNPNAGGPSPVAYVTKLIEIALIVLLVMEGQQRNRA